MAKTGGRRGRDASSRRRADARAPSPKRATGGRAPRPKPAPPAAPESTGPFILGAIAGATPGRWIDAWNERMPRSPLELRAIGVATQRDDLRNGGLDAALVRLPIDADGLHVIELYDEASVVVASADSHLTVADDLALSDLVGEIVLVPADDVLGIVVPDSLAPSLDAPETTEDAIALVATGVGVVIVPMSLSRLHARRDVASRALRDGPTSTVALVWRADRTTPAVEAFVGIVRGRTPNSSR